MTTTAIRPAANSAHHMPRSAFLGKQDPDCTATRHGTATAYNRLGCRCPEGREAWRLYNKRRREGRNPTYFLPSVGTARRLQALVAIGWTYPQLTREAGVDPRTVDRILHGHAVITVPIARRIAAAYDRLSTTPGTSKRARNVAARYGWAPPLAWDDIDDPNEQPQLGDPDAEVIDEVAIHRALNGERVQLTRTERDRAVALGLDRGMTAADIARALHISGSRALELAHHIRATQAA